MQLLDASTCCSIQFQRSATWAHNLRIGQHNLQKVNSKINWQVGIGKLNLQKVNSKINWQVEISTESID